VDVDVLTRQPQRVAGPLGDEDARPVAGGTIWFECAAQRGDEGPQRAHRTGGRVGPQVVDEGVGGDHPPLGGDEPAEHLTVAGPAQRDPAAVVTEGPYGTEDVDSHASILRAGERPRPAVLIGC